MRQDTNVLLLETKGKLWSFLFRLDFWFEPCLSANLPARWDEVKTAEEEEANGFIKPTQTAIFLFLLLCREHSDPSP